MRKLIKKNPFSDLSKPEVNYWLGWIASDGCIHENRIRLSLKREDRDVIEKFRDFLCKEISIYDGIHKKPFGNFEFSVIGFRDTETSEFLISQGITHNKTLTLNIKFPITWDYFRGFFEGDGCLDYIGKNKNRPRIQIASSAYEHIKQLSKFLEENKISHKIYDKSKGRKSSHWSLEIIRKTDVNHFLVNIYANACTYMSRKYNNAYEASNGFTKMCQIQGTSVGNPEPSLEK